MFGNKKLEHKCKALEYRVEELENIICPHNSHQYVQVDVRWLVDYSGDSFPVYMYECKKCHKRKETMNYC